MNSEMAYCDRKEKLYLYTVRTLLIDAKSFSTDFPSIFIFVPHSSTFPYASILCKQNQSSFDT